MAHGSYNNSRAGSNGSKKRMQRMVKNLEPKIPLHTRPSKLPRRPRPMEKVETKPAKSIEANYPNTKSIQNISPTELLTSSIKSATAGVQPNMDQQEIREEKAYLKGEKKKQKIDKKTKKKFNKFTKKEKIKEARKEFRGK